MASIFRKDDDHVEIPNRNPYDMSFQNNLTLDIGSLRPCFCQPVMPGDSWSIESVLGLRFMPLDYPIQTRMKSSIHFFYVRNRNLWKDWPDFIGKTKEGLVPPYIHLTESNRKMIETCQLGDFLGMPTKIYGSIFGKSDPTDYPITAGYITGTGNFQTGYVMQAAANYTINVGDDITDVFGKYSISGTSQGLNAIPFVITAGDWQAAALQADGKLWLDLKFEGYPTAVAPSQMSAALVGFDKAVLAVVDKVAVDNTYEGRLDISSLYEIVRHYPPTAQFYLVVWNNVYSTTSSSMKVTANLAWPIADGLDVGETQLSQLPYRSDDNPSGIPISALPFRAYESIYNAFYRNAENNPLMINGVPEYNKWIRTNEGGADTNFYPIMYHNWEDDFLTTAVPSPQQGNAPLVGLSGTPTLTIAHDDGTTTQMQLDVNDEGQVTAVSEISGDDVSTLALMEAVSYGIAINDLRNVNSFQRWLENNIRRGYKYKDQIKTHYGVSVRYDELDMPEFIGGISEPVMVNQISQTVATESGNLGDMAGQASVFGQSKNITHYFDEHGFIIGIICVKPVANYSQLLPKYFNITDTFDYYFPEFGHIGMQPITYAEVTPLQAHLEGKLNDVFGYQRAWYDLISKTDEVHGLFRGNLRNFLINRTFDGVPELGKEFTVIDPDQINDVFAYTENTDKILGQVFFKCSKKTPIPLYGIPKLE